jgi:hypothetical protein
MSTADRLGTTDYLNWKGLGRKCRAKAEARGDTAGHVHPWRQQQIQGLDSSDSTLTLTQPNLPHGRGALYHLGYLLMLQSLSMTLDVAVVSLAHQFQHVSICKLDGPECVLLSR